MTQITACNASPSIVILCFETDQGIARPLQKAKKGSSKSPTLRRPHQKSRAGCARCKACRIKCDEVQPACSRCQQKQLFCTYPERLPKAKHDKNGSSSRKNAPVAFPTFATDTFTLQDMQFFHHFLIKATPHLPVGNDGVWGTAIPQFAHHNQFLMDAILGFGASHLSHLVNNDTIEVQALTYRIRGINGLRRALLKQLWTYGHADSLIASTYTLLLQTSYMPDGFGEWMRFLRLASSLCDKARQLNQTVAFDLRPSKHFETIEPYYHLMPSIEPQHLVSAIRSLQDLCPTLTDLDAIESCQTIEAAFKAHQVSPLQGYVNTGFIFKFWIDLNEEQFLKCTDRSNGEMQLLIAYFIVTMLLMVPQGVFENPKGLEWSHSRHLRGMLGWGFNVCENVPPALAKHLEFPENIIAAAEAESEGLPFSGPPVLQLGVATDLANQLKILRLRTSHW